MQFLLLTVFTIGTIAAASTVDAFSGMIAFYRDINYGYHLGTIKVDTANRCYNLDCGNLNNNVSSVQWYGFPTAANFDGETRAQVAFYADRDCSGYTEHYPSRLGGMALLSTTGMNDIASSFMVLQTSNRIENGVQSICKFRA